MNFRVTVQDPGTGASRTVEVSAAPESSVASLLAALPLGGPGNAWFVGAAWLDPASTVADSPLVPGAVLSLGAPGPDPRALPHGAVGALRALDGPDAGAVHWLAIGRHEIARRRDASVPLRDLDASRTHAEIRLEPNGTASVADLGSANGTRVDGVPLAPGTAVPLAPGAVLEIGAGLFEWVPVGAPPPPPVRSPDARLDIDRAFAASPAIVPVRVRMPQPVERNASSKATAVTTAVVPLVLGGVMAVVLDSPAMLLLGLFGPVAWAAQAFFDRRSRAASQARFDAAKAATQQTIAAAVTAEERARRAAAPDVHDVTLAATGRRRGVWPRNADSPDGLVVRVGTGSRPAAVEVEGEAWEGFVPPVVRGVPVTVDLRAAGVLGVVGPAAATAGTARWLVAQLATLRSPADLRLVVVTADPDGADALAWTAWLPHLDPGEDGAVPVLVGSTDSTRRDRIAELRDLVTRRKEAARGSFDGGRPAGARFGEDVVVVLDGALALRKLPGIETVLREGPEVGVCTIAVDRQSLNEMRAECAVDETGSVRLTRSRVEEPVTAHAEQISAEDAERVARALSPLRDRLTLAAAERAVPYPVRFLDLLGIARPTPDDVARAWARTPGPCTKVVLGADASGPVTVDLAGQGPHTMLGGATGAGKSILLQTLVTSLLLANRPDELNLVLVDFKGGSAFLPFRHCPHVVSLIRSTGETAADVFDAAAAERVLASVRAEVRRRESMLARFGGEIDEYWRSRGSAGWEPLPRLVLVFDEFARVLETSPNFLVELVNVAAKGRSLGMHLVLATQSLQGKLSPELKNNIDLRITLRQNEPADSVEVLGVPDAASIPGRLRGRGMILCTKDETRTPTLFQSGYLGDPPPTGQAPPAHVRLLDWTTLGEPRPTGATGPRGERTDQVLAIEAIEQVTADLAAPQPFRPLLPALPVLLPLADLPARATEPVPATAVPFGLVDVPDRQSQPAAVLDLAGTDRLLVAGGPQSGRTTVAAALLAGIVARWRPDEAHVYVLEREPGGLAAFEAAPHCGGVVTPGEPDRVRRLVLWLAAEVQRRAVARFSAPPGHRDPFVVLVVDGWEHFENRADPMFQETSLLQTLREVIQNGPPVGVHVVPIGGQDILNGKLPGLFTQRVLLPFPKDELRRSHAPTRTAAPPVLPGRAIDGATGAHLHVSVPDVAAALVAAKGHGVGGDLDPARLPVVLPRLPVALSLSETRAAVGLDDAGRGATWVPIGVGGPAVEPVGIDLFEAGPHLLLVTGVAGTGRTSVAATVARGLRAQGIGVLAVCPPRSGLAALLPPSDPGVRVVTGTTVEDTALREAAADLEAVLPGDRYAVVVDDCEQVVVTAAKENWDEKPTLLAEIAEPGSQGRRALVLSGDALPIVQGQRRALARVVGEVFTSGARFLLCPTVPAAAREMGFQLEPDQFFAGPPGRGHLAVGRTVTLVQGARP